MDRAIYTAMGGAIQLLEKQAITTNNLANASTPGFKAQLSALRSVPINGPTLQTRSLVVASTPGADMSEGVMNYTGRSMDVALPKESWLVVQTSDGEAYTHNGNIQINTDGQLTIQNHVLLGNGGPIEISSNAQINISSDGTISSLNEGSSPNTISNLGQLKLVKATFQEVERSDDGLFHLIPSVQKKIGNALQHNSSVRIMPGVLEGSNVNAVSALVDMITNSRYFDMQMKVISSADTNDQIANQLLTIS